MRRGLLIVGAGGHGKVIADSACESGRWDKIAFLDDKFPELRTVLDWPIIGNINEAGNFRNEYSETMVAVGDNLLRMQIIDRMIAHGFDLPVIIHPRAAVSRYAVLGEGTFVMNQAAVNVCAVIGKGCIVNTGATIGHDSVLGDFVHVAPGASIGGEAFIGAGSWVGMGAAIIERVKVGKGVVIGAGTVIVRDVMDDVVIVGVPGKIIKVRSIWPNDQ